jgi:hypothetical protein
MTKQEQLNIVNNSTKQEFINFAMQFNVFKTVKFPEYLEVRQAIIDKLPDHNLTMNDIMPIRIMGDARGTRDKQKWQM